VDSCNYVWTAQAGSSALAAAVGRGGQRAGAAPTKPQEPVRYRVVLEYEDVDPSFLELIGTKVTDQPVVLERDSTKRGYLHPVAGSEAAKAAAGLFTRPFAGSAAPARTPTTTCGAAGTVPGAVRRRPSRPGTVCRHYTPRVLGGLPR
jgi:hypothetical protein